MGAVSSELGSTPVTYAFSGVFESSNFPTSEPTGFAFEGTFSFDYEVTDGVSIGDGDPLSVVNFSLQDASLVISYDESVMHTMGDQALLPFGEIYQFFSPLDRSVVFTDGTAVDSVYMEDLGVLLSGPWFFGNEYSVEQIGAEAILDFRLVIGGYGEDDSLYEAYGSVSSVSVVSQIPEPSATALVLGLVSMSLAIRRRRERP